MFVEGNVKFHSRDEQQTSVYCIRAGQLYEFGNQTSGSKSGKSQSDFNLLKPNDVYIYIYI